MKTDPGLERCLTYINCEINPPPARGPAPPHYRAITISRQTGSGGHAVAEKLSEMLENRVPAAPCPWTVFDRNLVEKVLEDHNLPARLARFMPEDRISEVSDTMDELFGLHPPSWSLVRDVSDTILRLVEKGNVIVIGRAGAVIAARVEHVFHVRLIGSVERRLHHLMETNKIGRKAALAQLNREDRGRARYLKKYFGKEIEDPLFYHLVINTDMIGYEDAAGIIVNAMLSAKPVADELPA
jgi:cytidylate kinase